MNYNRIIYKYVIPVHGLTLELANPKVLTVAPDPLYADLPVIWIESDVTGLRDTESITFEFFGTGQHIPNDYTHVGSCRTTNEAE
jgi:hypothetical protein